MTASISPHLAESGAHFDVSPDGFAEHLSWTSTSDAFLIADWNNDGVVNDGNEMFGDSEHSGHAASAAFDLDGDGRIDTSDSVFASLRLGNDTDSDGATDAGELYTLPSLGVTSIRLTATDERAEATPSNSPPGSRPGTSPSLPPAAATTSSSPSPAPATGSRSTATSTVPTIGSSGSSSPTARSGPTPS